MWRSFERAKYITICAVNVIQEKYENESEALKKNQIEKSKIAVQDKLNEIEFATKALFLIIDHKIQAHTRREKVQWYHREKCMTEHIRELLKESEEEIDFALSL